MISALSKACFISRISLVLTSHCLPGKVTPTNFSFTPKPNVGAKHPKHQSKVCYGKDLTTEKKLTQLNLEWLIDSYQKTTDKETFFNSFFTKLAGRITIEASLCGAFAP